MLPPSFPPAAFPRGGSPIPRPAAPVQPQGSSAAPPQSLARCAPAGATARRDARGHTQGAACPLAGGAGGARTRSRGAGAQMPLAFPRRSAGRGGAASVWPHACPRRRLTPAAAAALGRGRRWGVRCAFFFLSRGRNGRFFSSYSTRRREQPYQGRKSSDENQDTHQGRRTNK